MRGRAVALLYCPVATCLATTLTAVTVAITVFVLHAV